MPREIERKFLLLNDTWRARAQRRRVMSQGYLAGTERASIRVRISGDDANLNIKSGGLVASRLEFEYAIPVAEARELLTLCEGPLIEKTRHYVDHDGMTWEIDEFFGDIILREDIRKKLTRKCAKNTLFRLKGDAPNEWRTVKSGRKAKAAAYNPNVRQWLLTTYSDQIETIANEGIGRAVEIEFQWLKEELK